MNTPPDADRLVPGVRRSLSRAVFMGLATALAAAPALAQQQGLESGGGDTAQVEEERDRQEAEAVDGSVRRGVGYLLSRQNPDGSISPSPTHSTALTSLAILAITGAGHQPGDPTPEGQALRRALEFILQDDRQEGDGYFGQRDGSRMYGHGITTLMISEMLGMGVDAEQDAVMRRKLLPAIDLILRSQQVQKMAGGMYEGGWRYTPGAVDSDLSITVWQVMALRSASAAGLEVPSSAIDQAVEYVRRSFRMESRDPPMGQFAYQPGRSFGYAATASGLLALQVCGRYDAPEVEASARWLLARPLDPQERWFYYGTYYYAQGLYQRGGAEAATARQRVESSLIDLQHDDGSWSGGGEAQERVYATSMALLSLSVRYHYLPIYQR